MSNRSISTCRVTIGEEVISARYSLSAGEKCIVYCALGRIDQKKELELGEFYGVSVKDFAEMRGTTMREARESLLTAEQHLFDRVLHIKGEDRKDYKLRWIVTSTFDRENDILYIKWHESILPYLSQLQRYCTIQLSQVGDFRSTYTYRLWEILSLNKFKSRMGVLYFDLKTFLDVIEASPTNRKYKYLKTNVLLVALKELTRKELVYTELLENKRGKTVIGFYIRYWFCDEEDWKHIKGSEGDVDLDWRRVGVNFTDVYGDIGEKV